MDKSISMVYNLGCGFKDKGQDVNCTTSGRKNAVSMSVTLYFTLPFESAVLKKVWNLRDLSTGTNTIILTSPSIFQQAVLF